MPEEVRPQADDRPPDSGGRGGRGRRWGARILVVAAVGLASVAATTLATGCSPGYVLRAGWEEAKILNGRRSLPEVILDPATDAETRAKLTLAYEAREFARDSLLLDVGDSYTTYTKLDRDTLAMVLSAARSDSLAPVTWWFPIVGHVPYRGFFDLAEAEREQVKLEAEGFDTYLRPTAAFSTLGWFDDPLLGHLLKLDRISLAEVVLHELLHNTLFVKGSVAFNESLANFVGKRGAIDFFVGRNGPHSPEALAARRAWREELEFSGLMMEMVGCLHELYGGKLPEADKLRRREQVFTQSRRQWARALEGRPDHRHASFSRRPLDNAVILQSLLYVTDLARFEEIYRREGKQLTRAIEAVRAGARDGGDPFDMLPASTPGGIAAKAVTYGICETP